MKKIVLIATCVAVLSACDTGGGAAPVDNGAAVECGNSATPDNETAAVCEDFVPDNGDVTNGH